MEKTTNYNLNKPSQDDFYNVDDFNANADIVDRELKANAEAIDAKKGLELGETETTAYAGNKGKAATDAINAHKQDDNVHVTPQEKSDWHNKSNFSGSYADLADKPTNLSESKQFRGIIIPTASWVDDTITFADYPYKADIIVNGITAAEWACISLTPDHTDRALDSLCSFVFIGDGVLSFWIDAVPDHDVVIENVVFERVV